MIAFLYNFCSGIINFVRHPCHASCVYWRRVSPFTPGRQHCLSAMSHNALRAASFVYRQCFTIHARPPALFSGGMFRVTCQATSFVYRRHVSLYMLDRQHCLMVTCLVVHARPRAFLTATCFSVHARPPTLVFGDMVLCICQAASFVYR